jgi:hypothetical protein
LLNKTKKKKQIRKETKTKEKPKKGRNTQKLPNKGREERNHMRVTITQRFQNININNQFFNLSSGNLWIVLVETIKSILSL